MTPARADWLLRRWLAHWLDAPGWRGIRADLIDGGFLETLERAEYLARDRSYSDPALWGILESTIPSTSPDDRELRRRCIDVAHTSLSGRRDLVDDLVKTCPRPPRDRSRTIRVPHDLDDQVAQRARKLKLEVSEVYRRAVAAGLGLIPSD